MSKKKKKEEAAPTRFSALAAAKAAHQYSVGVGGSIYHDANMSHVRGLALPCIPLMELTGNTGLRDSMTILIDGEPGASKSSLSLEMINWSKPYAGAGSYYDGENKSAVDIASGTLDLVHLYHPTQRIEFMTCPNIEVVQTCMETLLRRCKEANASLPRNQHIPFIGVIDPLCGTPSFEHVKHVKKGFGVTDRGHGGRDEALLWTKWIAYLHYVMVDIPFILIMTNHMKEKTEKVGAKMVERKVNPGGKAQNFNAALGLRTRKIKSFKSESLNGASYELIGIECTKNSHGPTGNRMAVRKYTKRGDNGQTLFWWDWDRATADFLVEFGPKHESRDVLSVTKGSESRYTCKKLGLTDVDPAEIGKAINDDPKLVEEFTKVFKWKRIKEYDRITEVDYEQLVKEAMEEKQKNADVVYDAAVVEPTPLDKELLRKAAADVEEMEDGAGDTLDIEEGALEDDN